MSFPRYPVYRDSGSPWLGQVPQHWAVVSMRWISKRYSGGTPDKTVGRYWVDGTIPWLNSGAVNAPLIVEPSAFITEEALECSSAKWIPEGALVMALAGQGKTKGMVAQLGIPTTSNQSMAAIVPTQEIDARFLFWWLQSNYQNIRNMAGGDLRDGLNLDLLGSIPCPLMPIGEQQAIASLLDRETAKIDALVAEQEKLITLLKEKRQAVILQAVTKGLEPTVPMKDSGVEWLGEVPAHWKVGKAGFYVTVLPGYAFPSTGFSLDDSNVKLLRGVNVGVGELRWDDVVYWSRTEEDGLDMFELQAGDVVIGMDRPLISSGMRVAFVRGQDLPCLLLQRVAKVQPSPAVDGRFVMRLLSSRAFEAHFAPDTTGISVPHISGEQISSFVIPVPPLDEQQEICDFLDAELEKLNALNLEAERAILLLAERRSALISAAVTGQIDVRGAMTASTANREELEA